MKLLRVLSVLFILSSLTYCQKWVVFNTSNSGLPDNYVYEIAIDVQGNKWIGTDNGLSVFNEEGVKLTDIREDNPAKPKKYLLNQNYPNPFNPTTRITYSIPEGENVKLTIYDILGKEVSTLVNEYKAAGQHTVQFNGSSLPSGIYIYTIQASQFRDRKKIMILK